jgi:DNA repair protein RecO (recombination protein O)
MQWTDDGIVLSARRHGETAAILVLLTHEHGRHAGLVLGATGKRLRGVLQPGNQVGATWRARLAEHLGTYTLEPAGGVAADLLDDGDRLAGLASACAVADLALPEREPHPRVHAGLAALLTAMADPALGDAWIAAYVRWELGLLADLGYGLDLTSCAVTGSGDDLVWVSPRTGRAVSRTAGEPYRDRLLALPPFLTGRGGGEVPDLVAGLALTGHFLVRHVLNAHGQEEPPARHRFVGRLGGLDPAGTAT